MTRLGDVVSPNYVAGMAASSHNALNFEQWRPLVYHLLDHAESLALEGNPKGWSLQGFGMFRLYLAPNLRLHVWDPEHRVEDVTDIHDHPWSFDSTIIAGTVTDQQWFKEDDFAGPISTGKRYLEQLIQCGPGGGARGEATPVRLVPAHKRTYRAGECYRMSWRDLHATTASPGAVTLISRKPRPDPDHARVYFPEGKTWVSAEPAPAPPWRLADALGKAIKTLDAEM
jgi:hypothetical protein